MKTTLLWLLTGGPVAPLLLICGIFFLILLRGKPLFCPRGMLRAMKRPTASGGVSPFRAVTLALAGTLGVGNIIGVANALAVGGAGAVLWMWISALLAMILKYAEILLAVLHRREHPSGGFYGGAAYYIRDFFASKGRDTIGAVLAGIFSILILLNALSVGCAVQVNAISSAAEGVAGISPWICGILILLLALPVVVRGVRGISALTEYLVPIMSGGYILLSIAVLILRRDALLPAFSSIFKNAFTVESATGGVIGFLTSRALRVGTMRGLLTNEAGCGTAPTAHACADTDSPAAQGVWGIFEVFVDTILICTATALVILVNVPDLGAFGDNAVMMTIHAYSVTLGGWSEFFFLAAILCFGYATVLCWASYGMESVRVLTSKKPAKILYLFLFFLSILIGAVAVPAAFWPISDFAIASLTLINLCMLICMRREICTETARFFGKKA